jgi:hypothetical protein
MCGVVAGKTGPCEATLVSQDTDASFVQLNFTGNSVSLLGSAIGALEEGNLTATFLTAVSNDGPSVVHDELSSISNIADSNFFNNTIDNSAYSALGLFYIQFTGIRLTRCVVSSDACLFYAARDWTSPFIISDCVFSNALPATAYVSAAGNSVRANPTPLAFAVVVPDLCGRFATACPTWSVSPKPTKTLSPVKTRTETPRDTPTNSIAETQSLLPPQTVAETQPVSESPSSSPAPGAQTAEQTLILAATPSKSNEADGGGGGGEGGGSDAKDNAAGGSAGLGIAGLAGIAAGAVALIAIVIVVVILRRTTTKKEPTPELEEGLAAVEPSSAINVETELGHDYQNPLTLASGVPETMGQWEGDGGND